jgi:hypothetical protein
MLTELQQELIRYLEMMKAMRLQMGGGDDYTYKGMEHFLLEHGQWYEPRPWTGEYRQGAPKLCFANAMMLGDSDNLRYVEGVAVSTVAFPIYHAWNLDAAGELVDSTWLNRGVLYFGVEFSVGRADDAIWNGNASVLDDFNRRHPLFREPWPGEDYSVDWKPSKGRRLFRQSLPAIRVRRPPAKR